jgi:DNA-cytosine methyltransferase
MRTGGSILKTKLKVLDLFSGIGGFSLGLHSTDIFDTVKFVEFDEFCQKILKKNFPNVPIEGDIKNVRGKEFEADIIVGGFPCQPFSVAGKQKGRDDNRYLWPEMFRLVKEIKPEFVIGENVQGLVNLQNGMVLRQVQDDLEGEGFEVQCFLIPASGIGAWHQRFRVWIVGHSKHNGLLATEKRSRNQEVNGRTQEGQNQTIESERTSGSRNDEDVSNTDITRSFKEHSATINRQNEGNGSIDESSSRRNTETKEDVSNTENRRGKQTERQGRESIRRGSDDRIWFEGERKNIKTNVSNTESIKRKGEKAGLTAHMQMRGTSSIQETIIPNSDKFRLERDNETKEASSRRWTEATTKSNSSNVSYTISTGSRGEDSRNFNEQGRITTKTKRESIQSKDGKACSNDIESDSSNVSNTISELSHGCSSTTRDSEAELIRLECNEGWHWNQVRSEVERCSEQSKSTNQTWWQIESNLCGVPNGISRELDKDRASRIKSLGNAIVPQMARIFGLAIKKVLSDSDCNG